jgi:hypothetical protein
MVARACRNGCGRMLEWDPNLEGTNKYIEVGTGMPHKGRCPNYSNASTNKFEQNKQQYGQGYSGPSVQDGLIKDVQDHSVRLDSHELRIKELERTLSGLDAAIAKLSFKPASELEGTGGTLEDESTN